MVFHMDCTFKVAYRDYRHDRKQEEEAGSWNRHGTIITTKENNYNKQLLLSAHFHRNVLSQMGTLYTRGRGGLTFALCTSLCSKKWSPFGPSIQSFYTVCFSRLKLTIRVLFSFVVSQMH